MAADRPPESQLIERLVDCLPSVRVGWRAFKQTPDFSLDLPYTALGYLAAVMVRDAHFLAEGELTDFFNELEEALARSDSATRSLLIVGFIEDLQNVASHHPEAPVPWLRYAGERTRIAWGWVNGLWSSELSPLEFNRRVENGLWRA